jgi:signal transduction histidine kinase
MTNMNLLQMGDAKWPSTPSRSNSLSWQPAKRSRPPPRSRTKTRQAFSKEPIFVQGDLAKLELLFANLLSNAIRFTPDGGQVRIAARLSGKEVWVEIQDNGIGIPADELENIFKEFYQVEDHLRRRHGGMGLGLAIARGIVRLHNGRIWAESPGENKGTTIKVVLPHFEE